MAKLGMTHESIGPPRIVAQSNVLNRMSAPATGNRPDPRSRLAQRRVLLPSKDFFFNGEAVVVITCRRRTPTATAWCSSADPTC